VAIASKCYCQSNPGAWSETSRSTEDEPRCPPDGIEQQGNQFIYRREHCRPLGRFTTTTKRDVLQGLTRGQLKDLAAEFEVEFDSVWTKERLVESLASSRKLDAIGVEELSKRISETGDVASAIRWSRQAFFTETAGEVFSQLTALADAVGEAIATHEIVEEGYLAGLGSRIERLRQGKINQTSEVPPHIWKKLSPKQRGAYGTAKSLSYQIPKHIETALVSASSKERVVQHARWKERGLPTRVEYYILQGFRCYSARCYDACIVMLARALEHLLKLLLKNRKVTVPEKATLGSLVDLYRKSIGDDKVLEKVLEVANMDRVISAHDIPPYDKQMDVKDANHAWTALDIVLRELPWTV